MTSAGILVGCDQSQEWMLHWWWENYSLHNSYPVCFFDFGMSEKALSWCKEKGTLITLSAPHLHVTSKEELPSEKAASWEALFGKGVWIPRLQWFKKPLALLQSPYDTSIWMDLDCEIKGSLEPLFQALRFGGELAAVKDVCQEENREKGFYLPGEINYYSGLIVFKKEAPILHHWTDLCLYHNDQFAGDQDALTRAIFLHKPSLIELPAIYNWMYFLGENKEALVLHYCSGEGKLLLLKKLGLLK